MTGTRRQLTAWQWERVAYHLAVLRLAGFTYLHHGDCVGADAGTAEIARQLGYRIVGHPPVSPRYRAWFPSDETREPRPYLLRNDMIVSESGWMLALPDSDTERVRSGTWSTVRQARRWQRPIMIIMPDRERLENG